MMADAPYERWRHLDERGSKHIGHYERPGACDVARSAMYQLQSIVESVDACVLCGNAESGIIDVDADCPRYALLKRGEREHARSCSHVQHAARRSDLHRFLECFEAERRRWMESGAERPGVNQSDGGRRGLELSWDDANAPDLNWTLREDPH